MGEIVREDLKKIAALLEQVLGTREYETVSRMGGMTNRTYRVTMKDGKSFAVRIPGEGTEALIVRKNEKISTQLAFEQAIDAELLYFGEDGSKVTRFIPNAVTMSAEMLRKPKHIKQVADILRRIHTCGADTKVPFEVFDMAGGYEKIIEENGVAMFSDYQEIKAKVMNIKKEIDAVISVKKVPCHNDPLCGNWVEGNGRMYLIDWEYAGMNDGMWDLADVSIEAGFDEKADELLLQEYRGGGGTRAEG